ncbi:MAG: hypothetical protein FWF60_06370 [Oscillospiraceae bacterium]|nr:hypothetical protein [Oscillospiraceae bacterium]
MDFILSGLDAMNNLIGFVASAGVYVNGFRGFGRAIADFYIWLIGFIQGIIGKLA